MRDREDDMQPDQYEVVEDSRIPMLSFMRLVEQAGMPQGGDANVKNAYLAAVAAISAGIAMLAAPQLRDPVSEQMMYDTEVGFVHEIQNELRKLDKSIPDYSVGVQETWTRITIGANEWRIQRGTESEMLALLQDKLYHSAHTAAAALLSRVMFELYKVGLIDPNADIEEHAKMTAAREIYGQDKASMPGEY